MSQAILCENIEFSYTPTSSRFHFSMGIKKNDFALLTGKSGCGKSTLLSLIAGLLKPEKGRLFLNDALIQDQPFHLRDLAVLFHSYNVFPHFTVFQNIALGLSPHLKLSSAEKKYIFEILEELEIALWIHEKAERLSAGQLQRVGLARCLLQKKSILMLDEPFSSVDSPLRTKLLKWLWEKSKKQQKTVLIVTHSPLEAEPFADQEIIIGEGKPV